MTTENEKYDINLKEPKNFLLKNNVLKYNFFRWYMKKVYNTDLSEDYSVNYMCQDMSTANLKSPFFIKFGDDGVTSFSSKKLKPEPMPNPTPELTIYEDDGDEDEDDDEDDDEDKDNGDEDEDDCESEVSNSTDETDYTGPTFCSHTCVLKARQNLNKEKEESKKKDDDSHEHINEISENTFDIDFSKNLLSSIVRTEQQKSHLE